MGSLGIASTCGLCFGTGIFYVANFEDDSDATHCICEDGQLLRAIDEKNV